MYTMKNEKDLLCEIFRMKELAGLISENEMKSKRIYVLVGPPSVGKSTWIANNFKAERPYVINRDDLAERVASEYDWTYDDMFMTPPKDSEPGETSEKYGQVVPSPKAVSQWSPLSYSKVVEANAKVANLFNDLVRGAKGEDNIVVDMTNMNADSRKGALKAISGSEDDYRKIAVVFNFKGMEELIKKVAAKRAEEAERMGKSKTIGPEVFDSMFSRYREVSPEEGFDEVIDVDNTEALRNSLMDAK
jgi:hypothetical protein